MPIDLQTTITPIVGRDFPGDVIPEIEVAQNIIKVIVYDWRWYENDIGSPAQRFNQAIITAAKKGVAIKVITNIPSVVEILKKQGIEAKTLHYKGLIHAKLMIIDDRVVILGSHNYTQNAFTINQELSVMIKDSDSNKRFIDFFDYLFS